MSQLFSGRFSDGEASRSAALALFDACGDPRFYSNAAKCLHEITGVELVQLQPVLPKQGLIGATEWWPPKDASLLAEYEREAMAEDARIPQILSTKGQIVPDQYLVAEAAFERTAMAAWLDRPHIDLRWAAATTLPVDGDLAVMLGLCRSRRSGRFHDGELSPARDFLPLLRQATELHIRLQRAQQTEVDYADALSVKGEAVFFLGRDGQVLRTNELAEGLARGRRGLTIRGGKLVAEQPEDREILASAIRVAVENGAAVAHQPIRLIWLDWIDCRPSLLARIVRLDAGPRLPGSPQQAVAAVFVDEVSPGPSAQRDSLVQFGLTGAEAAIALAIFDGNDVRAIARQRDVSVETVRSQIKSISGKLGVRRQSELVKLLAKLGI